MSDNRNLALFCVQAENALFQTLAVNLKSFSSFGFQTLSFLDVLGFLFLTLSIFSIFSFCVLYPFCFVNFSNCF